MQKHSPLTMIDLFAGCGGLSLGMEEAGFHPLFVNELNQDALETYLVNRESDSPHLRAKYQSRDIKECIQKADFFDDLLDGFKRDFKRDFSEDSVDLLTGGPPCQGFSGIGIRRSYAVDKVQLPSNHLFQDMAYFIHRIRPKVFLFENVEGLLRARWTSEGQKGEIFEDVLNTFSSIPDYVVQHKLVYGKDFGVPQNRPRVIIIGIRGDVAIRQGFDSDPQKLGLFPIATGNYPHLEDIFSDLIDDDFQPGGETKIYNRSIENKWQEYYRTDPRSGHVMESGSELTEQQYSRHAPHVIERFSSMIENQGKIPDHLKTKKFAQRVLPKRWGNRGPNITACSLPDDFVHYSQPRSLTVREWARLQTFPDWYRLVGKRTTGGIRRAGNPRASIFDREVPKYTQIGNAVAVKMASALGAHLRAILER